MQSYASNEIGNSEETFDVLNDANWVILLLQLLLWISYQLFKKTQMSFFVRSEGEVKAL